MNLAAALLVLAAAIVAAVARPRGAPDWLVASAGAALLLATGVLPPGRAADTARELAPTLLFLIALLVLAEGCRSAGLFAAAGARVARAGGGDARALLAATFGLATVTTVALSLDATVVLLTPVLVQVALRARADPRPPLYACGHLANSASLLLPVSNLTNLLAFHASGLSFTRFAALMAAPWAVAVAIEWRVLSRAFPGPQGAAPAPPTVGVTPASVPAAPLVAVGLTLLGFLASPLLGVEPVWIACAGAALMLALVRPSAARVATATQPGFLAFVVALGLIVAAAGLHGLDDVAAALIPQGDGPFALVTVTLVAAVAANLLNNLPATLLLLPAASAAGPPALLAMLIGVGVGPNLTYAGSLATLLWRRILQAEGQAPMLREFTRVGVASTLPALVLAPLAVWVVLQC